MFQSVVLSLGVMFFFLVLHSELVVVINRLCLSNEIGCDYGNMICMKYPIVIRSSITIIYDQ